MNNGATPNTISAQSQKHHLSSSTPRSVTLEVILGGKLARLAGRLPGASGRQSSPGGFAYYFHKTLNWSQFQARPVTFIYINSSLQTCSDFEQECWKRKKAHSPHGGCTTISINVSSSENVVQVDVNCTSMWHNSHLFEFHAKIVKL